MSAAKRNLLILVSGMVALGWLSVSLNSCGKATTGSPQLLNIRYHVINLSPDLLPVDLFIDFRQVNTNPYIFGVDQGYFYIPSTDTPYQIRSAKNTGFTLLHSDRVLHPGAIYTLYLIGAVADNSLDTLSTVDTAASPPAGRGGIRFVNLSPTALGGLDVYANGTKAFSAMVYKQVSAFVSVPAGNYDIQIDATGTTTILSELNPVTIQNGKLYTIYSYGYTSRADSAGFTSRVTANPVKN